MSHKEKEREREREREREKVRDGGGKNMCVNMLQILARGCQGVNWEEKQTYLCFPLQTLSVCHQRAVQRKRRKRLREKHATDMHHTLLFALLAP